MKKAFLICPVRGHSPEETEEVVNDLEAKGYDVHWPHRDTNQDDTAGLDICKQNRNAINQADCVFIVWDGKSTGSLFDLGMAFAMKKTLHIIKLPELTEGKSFQNMMWLWEKMGPND